MNTPTGLKRVLVNFMGKEVIKYVLPSIEVAKEHFKNNMDINIVLPAWERAFEKGNTIILHNANRIQWCVECKSKNPLHNIEILKEI